MDHGECSESHCLCETGNEWLTPFPLALLTLEYRLYTVVPKLLHFLDDLSNVYIRLNRPRLKVVNIPIVIDKLGWIWQRGHPHCAQRVV